MADTAQDVMRIAAGELGYDRWTDPQPGTKYGRWYAAMTGDSYYGTSGVPYCAMFVSWVFAQAGASCPGLPGAYCPWIVTAGRNSGQTVSAKNARYGDVVLFDWHGDGVSDHVGLVEGNNGSYLQTIEGNTSDASAGNGGKVLRRTRAYSTVICVIRPKYSGKAAEVVTNEDINKIAKAVADQILRGPNGSDVSLGVRLGNLSDDMHNLVHEGLLGRLVLQAWLDDETTKGGTLGGYIKAIDDAVVGDSDAAGTGNAMSLKERMDWTGANTTKIRQLLEGKN